METEVEKETLVSLKQMNGNTTHKSTVNNVNFIIADQFV